MATVLVLFSASDEPESKRLRDLLQARLRESYNLTTIKDILAEGSTLDNELISSSCVILIVSKQSGELIKQGKAEKNGGGIVMFDGALIQQHIAKKNLFAKMVVVQCGKGSEEYVPDGFDSKKVFVVGEEGEAAILDQIVDTVKGTVSSKANEKNDKTEKKKKKCTQM